MTDMQILLDMQRTLGSLESSQQSVNKKLDDIHDQVKYTNGRVNKLRSDVDALLKDEGVKKKDASLNITWREVGIAGGALVTLMAYLLEKI